MNLRAGIRGGVRHAVGLALVLGAALPAARGGPALYLGEGGWAAVTGLPATTPPADGPWNFLDGVWIGRLPEGTATLEWGAGAAKQVVEAQSLPQAPVELPPKRNAFGPCVLAPLSVSFEAMVRNRLWTIVFPREGEAPAFLPLEFPEGRRIELALEIADVETGQQWILRPMRMGREREGGAARVYGGLLDQDVDWTLIVTPAAAGGRCTLQGRVVLTQSAGRLLHVRVLAQTGAAGKPLLQAECPPAVVAATDGTALALLADPEEPRRFRAVTDKPGFTGLEFDLAVTKATGNFPLSATFSLSVEAWPADGAAAAEAGALARLAPAETPVPLPDFATRDGLGTVPRCEPARLRLAHPGGFRDPGDVMQYLMLKTSGLFPDRDWAASAFLCAARDTAGAARIEFRGTEACVAVNPDPDLDTMLEMGPNRGLALLADIQQRKPAAVWIRTLGTSPGLDHNNRALYLCDYPAVWEPGSVAPGVDLRHAEIELLGSLACVLRKAGICLLVEDDGPLALFSTRPADALVCASADPAEMRRQHILAGTRPVVWLAENPGTEATQLARDFGFVRPGKIRQE